MARRSRCSSTSAKTKRARWSSPTKSPTLAGNNSGWSILQGRNVLLMSKQNPIRAHAATKIRYFSDRLLGLPIIGRLLGHSQAATTHRYAHLDADPLRRAVETIGSRLAAAMNNQTTEKVVELK